MEENNNIDNIFRSGLDGLEMIPSEKSWASIDAKLEKKRVVIRRNKGLRLFSFSAVLLILSYTAYRIINHGNNIPVKETETPLQTAGNDVIKTNPAQNSSAVSGVNITPNTTTASTDNKIISLPAKSNVDKAEQLNNSTSLITQNNITPAVNDEKKNVAGAVVKSPVNFNSPVNNVSDAVAKTSSKTNTDAVSKTPAKTNTVVNENKASTPSSKSVTENKSSQNSTASAITKTASGAVTASSQPISKLNPQVDPSISIPSAKGQTSETERTKAADNAVVRDETQGKLPKDVANDQTAIVDQSRIAAQETNPVQSSTAPSSQDASDVHNSLKQDLSAKNVVDQKITENRPVDVKNESTPSANGSQDLIAENQRKINDPSKEIDVTSDSATSAPQPAEMAAAIKPDYAPSLLKKVLSRLSVDVFYSPDYVQSRLSVNSSYTGPASTNLADYDKNKPLYSYSTGMNVRFDLSSKWSVGSGVAYSNYSQTAEYNSVNVVSDSAYQKEQEDNDHHHGFHDHHYHHYPSSGGNNEEHHYIIHTTCGNIDLDHEPPHEGGTTPKDGDTISIKTTTTQTISYIYIPLVLRYQFGKNKFRYFIEGGAAFNQIKTDVVVVRVNDAYNENNSLNGLTSINYSLLLGAGVQYNFYKGLGMYLKPSLRYAITPINQGNPVNSYPYFLGIGAGISFHF